MSDSVFACSSTYQETYQKGFADGKVEGLCIAMMCNWILRNGMKRFGEAPREIRSWVRAIDDMDELEGIYHRLDDVKSWEELRKS